jgi:hypothetical protein
VNETTEPQMMDIVDMTIQAGGAREALWAKRSYSLQKLLKCDDSNTYH